MNTSDSVNCLLNYGYAILESECRKALNSVGLEPTIVFLHESHQARYALCYDLQEVFRWLAPAKKMREAGGMDKDADIICVVSSAGLKDARPKVSCRGCYQWVNSGTVIETI